MGVLGLGHTFGVGWDGERGGEQEEEEGGEEKGSHWREGGGGEGGDNGEEGGGFDGQRAGGSWSTPWKVFVGLVWRAESVCFADCVLQFMMTWQFVIGQQ